MGMRNHSRSIVAKHLPADVRGQIELDLTEGSKSQTEILEEYSARYVEEFAQFSDRAFYRWCQGILDEWDRQRRELARERLRLTFQIRNSDLASVALEQCDEAGQRMLYERLAAIAANPETDNGTLKQLVGVVDSIGVLGKLNVQRQRLDVLQAENERRAEAHELKMASLKAAVKDEAAKSGDGKLDKAVVFDLIDKAMRGESIGD